MKVAIIVPYFGKLPNYFQMFLDSCSSNNKFNWIIFSDDTTQYCYPENVQFIEMTFHECQSLVQLKFDFKIELSTPQKLCDYKCAYGLIFEQYLKNYAWWGHCDLDQVFGDLSSFITEEMMEKYDKIGSLGHLTLYRNTVDNCREFMRPLNGRIRYREVFTTSKGCAFDEWLPDNINDLYINSERPVLLENLGADINSYRTQFSTVYFDVKERKYNQSNIKNSIFQVKNGKVFQIYRDKKEIKKIEYPYVHLQKRQMKDKRLNKSGKDYYIVPNSFIDIMYQPEKLLIKCKKWKILNYQYFRIKSKSFIYRVKSGDWVFDNVFK